MCISEWIVEDKDFRSAYQAQLEIYLAQSGEYLLELEKPAAIREVATMPELLVPEAHMPIAA